MKIDLSKSQIDLLISSVKCKINTLENINVKGAFDEKIDKLDYLENLLGLILSLED